MKTRSSAIVALLSMACLSQAQIAMQVQQTIEGFSPTGGTIPVTAEIENNGPDARGVLRVTGRSFRTDYPIEIPRGGRKQLIVYPQTDWGEINFALVTNQGRISQNMSPESKWQPGQQVLMLITDSPGELSFIRNRTESSESQLSVQDAYCKPGKSPDRPIGYTGIGAVLLGSGSERLSDREVESLKLWTLSGGTLVFVGGASAPIVNDPRWADVLPLRNFRSRNVRGSRTLTDLASKAAPSEFSITTGDPIPSANTKSDGANVLTAERQFGIGRVIYLSFNLMEEPFNSWEGRRTLLMRIVRPPELAGRRTFVANFSRESVSSSPPPMTVLGTSTAPVAERDPFSTKLPPATEVFLVLGIYFIVVVPVNFLFLKKLGRAELAWFTAPVISLAFAGLLFTRAQDLYSAQMSSASQGILVAQQGIPDGMFIGASQVFIPRGGSYDLKLNRVDSVGVVEDESGYYYGGSDRSATVDLDPVDDGEIHVPALRANNLAFKEISYRQIVPDASEWFKVSRVGPKQYAVRNLSSHQLNEGVLFVGKKGYRIDKPIEAGSTARVVISEGSEAWDQQPSLNSIMTSKSLALYGKLVGIRPGPQLGKEVVSRTSVRYAFVTSEAAQ